ncbi:hypothetical protein ACLOJK_000444 [Asimina triloba]
MIPSKLSFAFDLKLGQLILVALLLMIASFYIGTLHGRKATFSVLHQDRSSEIPPIAFLSCTYLESNRPSCRFYFQFQKIFELNLRHHRTNSGLIND